MKKSATSKNIYWKFYFRRSCIGVRDRIEISYGEELDTGRKVIYLSPNQGGYKLTHNNKNNSYNCHITTSLNYFNKQFISHLLKNDADGKRIMDHEVDGRDIIFI